MYLCIYVPCTYVPMYLCMCVWRLIAMWAVAGDGHVGCGRRPCDLWSSCSSTPSSTSTCTVCRWDPCNEGAVGVDA